MARKREELAVDSNQQNDQESASRTNRRHIGHRIRALQLQTLAASLKGSLPRHSILLRAPKPQTPLPDAS